MTARSCKRESYKGGDAIVRLNKERVVEVKGHYDLPAIVSGLLACGHDPQTFADCEKLGCPYRNEGNCIPAMALTARRLIHELAVSNHQMKRSLSSEHAMTDLDVIKRIRSGDMKKYSCHDYAIYNGDWYREHPWFTPEGGELLRAFVMDMESSNSIINTVNIHNMSLDHASRILMLCGPACDLLSPEGFIRWLKEKMMDNPQIREEVMRNA